MHWDVYNRQLIHGALYATTHIEGSLKGCSRGLGLHELLPQLGTARLPFLSPVGGLLQLLCQQLILHHKQLLIRTVHTQRTYDCSYVEATKPLADDMPSRSCYALINLLCLETMRPFHFVVLCSYRDLSSIRSRSQSWLLGKAASMSVMHLYCEQHQLTTCCIPIARWAKLSMQSAPV